ncbi:MAG: hypothetical protein ACI3V5_03265 [Faecousia sp.]
MAQFFHRNLPVWWRKCCFLILAFCWIAGLLSGAYVFRSAGSSLDSLMRGALFRPVSIAGLLCVTIFPFLFSAFAVYISEPRLLLLVCFGEAFVFSFVSLGLTQCGGSAGWLIRWLLSFSTSLTAPLLYLYWLRHLTGRKRFCSLEAAGMLCMCALIGSVDFRLISPFLAGLIHG